MRLYLFLIILTLLRCGDGVNTSSKIPWNPLNIDQNESSIFNPIKYLEIDTGYVYLFRSGTPNSEGVIIQIPRNSVNVYPNLKLFEVKYYSIDLNTFNNQFVKRLSTKKDESKGVRNVKIFLFDFPDFRNLNSISKLSKLSKKKNRMLSDQHIKNGIGNYYFYDPLINSFFFINKTDGINKEEKSIINALSAIKKISMDDALFYDEFISDSKVKNGYHDYIDIEYLLD